MINKVILIGNVGQDPEIRTGGSGKGWVNAKISLATTAKFKDKDGNWNEKTQWHRLVAWGYTAEYIEKFVEKGTLLYIEGEIEYGSYEDKKDGITRYTTDIKVNKARVMNRWKDSGSSKNNGGYGYGEPFPEPPPMGDDVPF